MAAQGERVSGAIGSCSLVDDSMAQDIHIPEQDIVVEELELPPQMNTEPEMGAAAAEAAVYDTSPSLLRNPPPIPAETARPSTLDMGRLLAVLTEMKEEIKKCGVRCGKWANVCRRTKWRCHVLRPTC